MIFQRGFIVGEDADRIRDFCLTPAPVATYLTWLRHGTTDAPPAWNGPCLTTLFYDALVAFSRSTLKISCLTVLLSLSESSLISATCSDPSFLVYAMLCPKRKSKP